jgi:hypothetical protein
MSEHQHEHEHDGAEVHCINCGGEIEDRTAVVRGMIEAMTKDFADHPDLAANFLLMLKLASEQR